MKSVMFSNNGSPPMRSCCPSITEMSERKCGSDRRSVFSRLIVTLVHCFHSPAPDFHFLCGRVKKTLTLGKTRPFKMIFEAKSWLCLRRCPAQTVPNFPHKRKTVKKCQLQVDGCRYCGGGGGGTTVGANDADAPFLQHMAF